LLLGLLTQEFSVRYPRLTFHHLFPGLVDTFALENQGFNPLVQILGSWVNGVFGAYPDDYANVPVAKALATSATGGLFLSEYHGLPLPLEKWAQNPENRKQLFEWALQRAQTAARTNPPENKVTEIK
jgi:hypothetical protein